MGGCKGSILYAHNILSIINIISFFFRFITYNVDARFLHYDCTVDFSCQNFEIFKLLKNVFLKKEYCLVCPIDFRLSRDLLLSTSLYCTRLLTIMKAIIKCHNSCTIPEVKLDAVKNDA